MLDDGVGHALGGLDEAVAGGDAPAQSFGFAHARAVVAALRDHHHDLLQRVFGGLAVTGGRGLAGALLLGERIDDLRIGDRDGPAEAADDELLPHDLDTQAVLQRLGRDAALAEPLGELRRRDLHALGDRAEGGFDLRVGDVDADPLALLDLELVVDQLLERRPFDRGGRGARGQGDQPGALGDLVGGDRLVVDHGADLRGRAGRRGRGEPEARDTGEHGESGGKARQERHRSIFLGRHEREGEGETSGPLPEASRDSDAPPVLPASRKRRNRDEFRKFRVQFEEARLFDRLPSPSVRRPKRRNTVWSWMRRAAPAE